MTHYIQRQYIHVDLQGSESEGFALQNRLSDLCSEWLNPAIGRVLDRCAPPDHRLCIDRLEVDAGTFSLENLEHGLTEAIVRALEKALKDQMPPGEGSASPDRNGDAHARLKNEQQAAVEAFLYFLETGRLPWPFRLPPGMSFEQFLLDIPKTDPVGDAGPNAPVFTARWSRTAFTRTLAAPQARKRLVMQFSEPFLQALLQQISSGIQASVARILDAVRNASAVPRPHTEMLSAFEKQLWETAFGQATQPLASGDTALLAMTLASVPTEVISSVLPVLKDILPLAALPDFVRQLATHSGTAFSTLAPLLAKHIATLSGSLSPEIQSLLKAGEAPLTPGKQHPTRKADIGASVPDKVETTEPAEASTPPTPGDIPREGIYVNNAGLVILHPFLQTFFEGLGIARDGALVQPDRALHLLHYLCTGHTPAPEYELTLPKMLCNIPLDTPVEADIVLTDTEKEEATALLQAAIRWWDALRDTSPDVLRGTFLCRPGKLSVRGDGSWLLQVERQGFDVLMDQLPWGISMVKLAWMEGMVWVEWG